jgi:hypothetical protein
MFHEESEITAQFVGPHPLEDFQVHLPDIVSELVANVMRQQARAASYQHCGFGPCQTSLPRLAKPTSDEGGSHFRPGMIAGAVFKRGGFGLRGETGPGSFGT